MRKEKSCLFCFLTTNKKKSETDIAIRTTIIRLPRIEITIIVSRSSIKSKIIGTNINKQNVKPN
ncbi:MAG: hypothetical protein ACFFG0_24130 [Candidatus Thorarchaeota archaeon]